MWACRRSETWAEERPRVRVGSRNLGVGERSLPRSWRCRSSRSHAHIRLFFAISSEENSCATPPFLFLCPRGYDGLDQALAWAQKTPSTTHLHTPPESGALARRRTDVRVRVLYWAFSEPKQGPGRGRHSTRARRWGRTGGAATWRPSGPQQCRPGEGQTGWRANRWGGPSGRSKAPATGAPTSGPAGRTRSGPRVGWREQAPVAAGGLAGRKRGKPLLTSGFAAQAAKETAETAQRSFPAGFSLETNDRQIGHAEQEIKCLQVGNSCRNGPLNRFVSPKDDARELGASSRCNKLALERDRQSIFTPKIATTIV